jgi:hypothetical protein
LLVIWRHVQFMMVIGRPDALTPVNATNVQFLGHTVLPVQPGAVPTGGESVPAENRVRTAQQRFRGDELVLGAAATCFTLVRDQKQQPPRRSRRQRR